jgi:Phage virion morphogenesis family
MAFLDVAITGIDDTIEQIEAISDRVADVTPVLEAIHHAFLNTEEARFNAEGPGWEALADSTLAQKEAKGYPADILQATRDLAKSLTEDDVAGSVWIPTPEGAEMGTDLKPANVKAGSKWADTALGAFHQEGTTKMPARPIIDTDDQGLLVWPSLISDWIIGSVAAASV